MAKETKKNKQSDEVLVDIVEVREQAQDFYEQNQKLILGVLGGLLLIVAVYLAAHFLYFQPRQAEASEQLSQAQKQFERDSFALALTNPGGGFSGFLDIIDNYKGTKAANLASYYAGISYLNLGKFDAAVSYLEDYKPSGDVMPIMKYGTLGDAYSEQNDFTKALKFYEKATTVSENEALTPYYLKKLGMLHERNGNLDKARKVYQQIKAEYPTSAEGNEIDKYLARLGE